MEESKNNTEHNRIEDIKRRLYDPNDSTSDHRHEGVLHPQNFKVADQWKSVERDMTMKKPKTSFFKKFFIVAFLLFLGAIGFAYYMYSNGGVTVSSDKIDITVIGNAFTKGGDELPLQIEITNRNNANLELADLMIEYPRGASDNATDVVRLDRDTIGTIAKGTTVTRSVKVKLFGDEKSVRNVKVALEYHPEGSNAISTKEKLYPVTISSAPVSIRIDAPDQATSDQPISFTITTTLNTTLPEAGSVLQVVYPNNFVFESAVPAPSVGRSVWSLASLTQTTPVTITVNGRLVGQDGEQQVFHVYAGTTSATDLSVVNVVYTSLLDTITITKPFLEARILVDNIDQASYTVTGGETVNADIEWSNNLPTRITDAQIIVNLSGNAFDRTAVNALEGFYDSANHRIIWDKNTISELASVEPGASGSVSFNFKPNEYVGTRTNVKDPQVSLDVSIRGNQPSLGSTFSNVDNFAKKVVKIASDFQIATSASFFSGPLPPKAESETKYAVTWTLSNSVNSINQAQARAVLPIYVNWVGPKTTSSENISYNATTREVIWNIGTVRPNTGFDVNREVSFIVAIKPSLSQVGSVPQLMKNLYLSGTDSFTRTLLKSSRNPITTLLTNDPNFKAGNERVSN